MHNRITDLTIQSATTSANVQLSRRMFFPAATAVAGSLLMTPPSATLAAAERRPEPFGNYAEVLKHLEQRGHKPQILGAAPDQSPIVAIRAGGQKKPAIFISAGAHSTEQAGVVAAVELLEKLKTSHEVWVVPTRDPIGLNGFRYALSLGLGEIPSLNSPDEADALLRERGEVLLDADGTLLALVGEYGYANRGLFRRIEKGSKVLDPLLGRRIYFASRTDDMPGAGPLERAYTLVVTPDGEILHLNRFHDTAWAPGEVRAIRRLMAKIQPGLTFDLHEHEGDSYWMSARQQRTPEDNEWELRMAREGIQAVAASGAELAPESYSPGSFFEKLQRGVYWLHAGQRGEGLNLADFAAAKYGPSFTIETGMRGPFHRRVEQQLLVVQTAVQVFERRYA